MEYKREEFQKEDGSIVTKTTVVTTPEDGWVQKGNNYTNATSMHREFQKGYSKNVRYETDSHKVIQIFLYSMVGIFSIIGIVLCCSSNASIKAFGFMWIAFCVYAGFCSKKEVNKAKEKVDKRKEEMNKGTNDVNLSEK